MQNIDLTKKKRNIKHKDLLLRVKTVKEIFNEIEIEKNKFCCYKGPISLKDVDIEKVLICNKISSGDKKL